MANDKAKMVSNKKPAPPKTPVTPVQNKKTMPPQTPSTYKRGGSAGKKMC